jgi:hypothetical protein
LRPPEERSPAPARSSTAPFASPVSPSAPCGAVRFGVAALAPILPPTQWSVDTDKSAGGTGPKVAPPAIRHAHPSPTRCESRSLSPKPATTRDPSLPRMPVQGPSTMAHKSASPTGRHEASSRPVSPTRDDQSLASPDGTRWDRSMAGMRDVPQSALLSPGWEIPEGCEVVRYGPKVVDLTTGGSAPSKGRLDPTTAETTASSGFVRDSRKTTRTKFEPASSIFSGSPNSSATFHGRAPGMLEPLSKVPHGRGPHTTPSPGSASRALVTSHSEAPMPGGKLSQFLDGGFSSPLPKGSALENTGRAGSRSVELGVPKLRRNDVANRLGVSKSASALPLTNTGRFASASPVKKRRPPEPQVEVHPELLPALPPGRAKKSPEPSWLPHLYQSS